jgi:hypothetical protein
MHLICQDGDQPIPVRELSLKENWPIPSKPATSSNVGEDEVSIVGTNLKYQICLKKGPRQGL